MHNDIYAAQENWSGSGRWWGKRWIQLEMLKVLEKEKIPFDIITDTSIGDKKFKQKMLDMGREVALGEIEKIRQIADMIKG